MELATKWTKSHQTREAEKDKSEFSIVHVPRIQNVDKKSTEKNKKNRDNLNVIFLFCRSHFSASFIAICIQKLLPFVFSSNRRRTFCKIKMPSSTSTKISNNLIQFSFALSSSFSCSSFVWTFDISFCFATNLCFLVVLFSAFIFVSILFLVIQIDGRRHMISVLSVNLLHAWKESSTRVEWKWNRRGRDNVS